jgi:hypothetical protein
MSNTRTFTRAELLALMLPWKAGDGGEILADEEVDERRWYVIRAVTFRLAGQPEDEAWRLLYRSDKTEMGDIDLWDDEAEVTATLVRKVTKMVEVWEPASEENTCE